MNHSGDDAVYVIAIRSAGPKNGLEVQAALESIRDFVEPVVSPQVVAHGAVEASPRHHEALRMLGFGFDAANSIYVVASETVAD